jgi:hypothetical protein
LFSRIFRGKESKCDAVVVLIQPRSELPVTLVDLYAAKVFAPLGDPLTWLIYQPV